jgi:hypothetical protein
MPCRARPHAPHVLDNVPETTPELGNCTSGRPFWPSRDPIEEAGGANLFRFVGNRPVERIDVYGLKSFPWGQFIRPAVPKKFSQYTPQQAKGGVGVTKIVGIGPDDDFAGSTCECIDGGRWQGKSYLGMRVEMFGYSNIVSSDREDLIRKIRKAEVHHILNAQDEYDKAHPLYSAFHDKIFHSEDDCKNAETQLHKNAAPIHGDAVFYDTSLDYQGPSDIWWLEDPSSLIEKIKEQWAKWGYIPEDSANPVGPHPALAREIFEAIQRGNQ